MITSYKLEHDIYLESGKCTQSTGGIVDINGTVFVWISVCIRGDV